MKIATFNGIQKEKKMKTKKKKEKKSPQPKLLFPCKSEDVVAQ